MGIRNSIGRGLSQAGLAIVLATTPFAMAGCSTHLEQSLTFNVSTGDSVTVTVDAKPGYRITADGSTFEVSKGDEDAIVSGTFTQSSQFDMYKQAMDAGTFDGTVETNGDDLLAWSYSDGDGEEHNRCVLVSDDTAVLMGSSADASEAEKAYQAITFSVSDE